MCAVYREAPVIQHLHHDLEYLYSTSLLSQQAILWNYQHKINSTQNLCKMGVRLLVRFDYHI